MSKSRHVFRDAKTTTWVACALLVAGAYLLHDAYEGRGRARPFVLRFLPAS